MLLFLVSKQKRGIYERHPILGNVFFLALCCIFVVLVISMWCCFKRDYEKIQRNNEIMRRSENLTARANEVRRNDVQRRYEQATRTYESAFSRDVTLNQWLPDNNVAIQMPVTRVIVQNNQALNSPRTLHTENQSNNQSQLVEQYDLDLPPSYEPCPSYEECIRGYR